MADKFVPLAIIVSRSEAVVVTSLLEAAGMIVNVGALHHASVEINSVALGHYRLTVPEWQHEDASVIVAETFGQSEWQFSEGLQTAVIKLFLAWLGSVTLMASASMAFLGTGGIGYALLWPLSFITVPVNPQGRSDYFLYRQGSDQD
jgi:hypothetical protein